MSFDGPTTNLADFASSVRFEDLSPGIRSATVRHHLDAVGCALGGLDSVPCRIARDVARLSPTTRGCSAFGIQGPVVPEQAVFANTCAIRQLDFNDGYYSPARQHPSDMLSAVVAAAELVGAPGRSVVLGAVVAYETAGVLGHIYPMRDAGWDQGAFAALGSALGAGAVLGLDFPRMANALSLALTSNLSLRSTRAGELSHWKGCATALATMNGLFAARLAERGMTGPEATFEGPSGLNEKIEPTGPLVIGEWDHGTSVIERSSFKLYPAEGASQAMIGALLMMRESVDVNRITRISIETWWGAWHEIGGGQSQRDHDAKWDPQTRETADHSLAYIVAVSLVDGAITPQSFEPERYLDPSLRPLMNKIEVRARADLTALDRERQVSYVTIEQTEGDVIRFSTEGHRAGHAANPLDDAQLSKKFQGLASRCLKPDTSAELEGMLWRLEDLTNIGELTRLYRMVDTHDRAPEDLGRSPRRAE